MYTKQFFKDGDLLNAEKLNHIEDGIVELENQLTDTGAVKEDYAYEVLMKNATFEYQGFSTGCATGNIYGNSLLKPNSIVVNGKYLLVIDNGVQQYEIPMKGTDTNNIYPIDGFDYAVTVKNELEYVAKMPGDIYESRNGDIRITVFYQIQDEKTLVKQNGTPISAPLVLDSTIDYTLLPFVGDEALQAILDGRQILVKVPNVDGGTLYANYMPVFQYQLPNNNNDFLTLLFLKDGLGTNLITALGAMMQGAPADLSSVYGQLSMKLSKTYTTTPLK